MAGPGHVQRPRIVVLPLVAELPGLQPRRAGERREGGGLPVAEGVCSMEGVAAAVPFRRSCDGARDRALGAVVLWWVVDDPHDLDDQIRVLVVYTRDRVHITFRARVMHFLDPAFASTSSEIGFFDLAVA